ncbi:putative tetraspanin Tsp3 [Rosellinia necatrix]|uniref:Putative tetraspanin Tsp3 n=1 Tax=Rosellinia necatrix TaxID=77044 RepID=A0A1W2TCA2_ROSNE|nr:putative tetraspanin Tsp3 [Rosellinia necatrix]
MQQLQRLVVIGFPLLMVALIGIAIYVQVSSSTLSLPIPTATTVLTILLPLFAAANVIYTPLLGRFIGAPKIQQLLLPALHIIQGAIIVVIATLAAEGFVPSNSLDCQLDTAWQALWRNKNGRAIERIQNQFDCCGYRSIKDQAWPPQPQKCAEIYGRHTACGTSWHAAMHTTSGLQFAVAVVAGIVQLAHLAYLRLPRERGSAGQVFAQRAEDNGRLIEEAYHDSDDEGNNAVEDPAPSTPPATQDNASHRVEPSGLGGEEANQWRS